MTEPARHPEAIGREILAPGSAELRALVERRPARYPGFVVECLRRLPLSVREDRSISGESA